MSDRGIPGSPEKTLRETKASFLSETKLLEKVSGAKGRCHHFILNPQMPPVGEEQASKGQLAVRRDNGRFLSVSPPLPLCPSVCLNLFLSLCVSAFSVCILRAL